jgi:hypothetical protein
MQNYFINMIGWHEQIKKIPLNMFNACLIKSISSILVTLGETQSLISSVFKGTASQRTNVCQS